MGERRGAYRGLVGKHEGKRPLGRPTRGWDYNIKTYLTEIRSDAVDWIDLGRDTGKGWDLVNAPMNLPVP
jgi:hypothetical protein